MKYLCRCSVALTHAHTFGHSHPEKFYHGFVLGLMVDLCSRYLNTFNWESGFGRYDIMLESLQSEDNAIIIEFKASNPQKEQIHKYSFVFEGKTVLIG
ncbi:MAG: hypothetical protein HFJ09_09780 [Lachnospiraceae bacterium]|nr:hypothetical protein [Lachnospiraceae bacterium]